MTLHLLQYGPSQETTSYKAIVVVLSTPSTSTRVVGNYARGRVAFMGAYNIHMPQMLVARKYWELIRSVLLPSRVRMLPYVQLILWLLELPCLF